jgi:hypothetical protein
VNNIEVLNAIRQEQEAERRLLEAQARLTLQRVRLSIASGEVPL